MDEAHTNEVHILRLGVAQEDFYCLSNLSLVSNGKINELIRFLKAENVPVN